MQDEGMRGDLEFGTIPGLVRKHADRFGDAPFIIDGDRTIAFAELPNRVADVAKGLLHLDVQRGDCVAIWAPNMWEWIVAALAVHSVGGTVVTVNTRYKGIEAAYLLNKSKARVLFTVTDFLDTNYVDLLRNCGEALPTLEHTVILRGQTPDGTQSFNQLIASGETVSDADLSARTDTVEPDDIADIIFTSGTTGQPKGVMCTHAQNLRAFRDWSEIVGLAPGDRYLTVLPYFHSFGYKAGWLASLLMGATVYPEPIFDVDVVLNRIQQDKITMLPGPPALFQTILARDDLDNFDLSSLRLCATGAAVIPVSLIVEMRDRLTFENIITAYGLSEATGVVTMCRADDDPETIATTSGRAIPGVDVQIVDDDSNALPANETGEIVVRGYNVMKGYFDEPEQTADAITNDGWLKTGDVGSLDAQGYIKITDRKKDMFIVGGFNAYPAEIETTMLKQGDLAQVAVVGMPDARMGEVGCAFVVPKAGREVDEFGIINWCRENMANYKVPRKVVVQDALPANATGKVLKFELREQAQEFASA